MGYWDKEKREARRKRRAERKETFRTLSKQDVIAMAIQGGGKITSASLALQTGMTVPQAWWKLNQMSTSGIFSQKSTNQGSSILFVLRNPELYQDLPQVPAPSLATRPQKEQVTDAKVIAAAVKAGGQLTPGMLCLALEIPIEQAKERLQALQHNGVFDIDATEAGGFVYLLRDLTGYQALFRDS